MARKRRSKDPSDGLDVEFVDNPPNRGAVGESWASRLEVVYANPGQWARVYIADTPEKAASHQSNLHSRRVIIPDTDGNWQFASRGCEVYAIYRGSKRRGSVRRDYRKG